MRFIFNTIMTLFWPKFFMVESIDIENMNTILNFVEPGSNDILLNTNSKIKLKAARSVEN